MGIQADGTARLSVALPAVNGYAQVPPASLVRDDVRLELLPDGIEGYFIQVNFAIRHADGTNELFVIEESGTWLDKNGTIGGYAAQHFLLTESSLRQESLTCFILD